MLQRPGSSWGFSALLKDTSVVVLKKDTPPTNNPCRTWDSNPQPSAYKSDSLSIRPQLPRTVISLDSLNLFTILCMVLGERPKFFAISHCEMWFLISLTLLPWNLAQSDEPWPNFACKDWDALFTQTWHLNLLPIHLLTVNCFKRV